MNGGDDLTRNLETENAKLRKALQYYANFEELGGFVNLCHGDAWLDGEITEVAINALNKEK